MKTWIVAATLIAAAPVFAGEYEFDDSDRNDMAGAWSACEDQYWEPVECAMVKAKCWRRPLIYHRNGQTRTYCKEDPIFSGTEADGEKALKDAKQMLDGG